MFSWTRPKWPGKKPTFFVDGTGATEADERQINEGRFVMKLGYGYEGDGSPTVKTMGSLWCNMRTRFYEPTIQNIIGSCDIFNYTSPFVQTTSEDSDTYWPAAESISAQTNSAGVEPSSTEVKEGAWDYQSYYLPTGVWVINGTMGDQCSMTGEADTYTYFGWQYTDSTHTGHTWYDLFDHAVQSTTGQAYAPLIQMNNTQVHNRMLFPTCRVIARPGRDCYVRLLVRNGSTSLASTLTISGPTRNIALNFQYAQPTAYEQDQLKPETAMQLQMKEIERRIEEQEHKRMQWFEQRIREQRNVNNTLPVSQFELDVAKEREKKMGDAFNVMSAGDAQREVDAAKIRSLISKGLLSTDISANQATLKRKGIQLMPSGVYGMPIMESDLVIPRKSDPTSIRDDWSPVTTPKAETKSRTPSTK
jgi:hypothetical protein